MLTVDIDEAKALLPQLVAAVEDGVEAEIVISRDGKPVARLVPMGIGTATGKRLGLPAGLYPPMSVEDFDAGNEEIETLFHGNDG